MNLPGLGTTFPERLRPGMPLPEGAVRLTSREVATMHQQIVTRWQPQSDVWPFTYATYFLTGGTSLSGLVTLTKFRNRFNLMNYARFSSTLATIGVPGVVLLFIHQEFIDPKILSVSFKCPECIKLRAGLIHGLLSATYPPLIAGSLCLLVSRQKKTYLYAGQKFVPNVRMFGKTILSMKYTIMAMFGINFAIGSGLAHFKMESLLNILTTLRGDVVAD